MSTAPLRQRVRSSRPARWRGFCPACAFIRHPDAHRGLEPSTEGLAITVLLVAALAAWVVTAREMLEASMMMGLGSFTSFAMLWTVMMAAMMLPSAVPFVDQFARQAEGRRMRPLATAALLFVYLGVWLAFGAVCYAAYNVLGAPWRSQTFTGAVALGLAAMYALTPVQRASQERCRELSALRGPLPFSVVRAGAVAGWRYALTCIGCSAGLMIAMVLVGMTSLTWTIVLAVLVLIYKLGPEPTWRFDISLSLAVAALAVVYAMMA